jgi:lysophospholipase L1-like esterase
VGTLPRQGCGVAHDGDNEGHGGVLATNVAAQGQLPGWLDATDPDIVMMHFGTNDVWGNRSPQVILDAFTTGRSDARPQSGWAAAISTPRSPVIVVDHFSGFDTASDTYDGVHPNAAGDQRMADRWFTALTAVLDGTPPDDPPTLATWDHGNAQPEVRCTAA